jgi:ketosteroid isomerase-like protein
MSEEFTGFLQTREQASAAYIAGDVAPLIAITARNDPASFMPPSGTVVTGAEAVMSAFAEGARQFRQGSRGRFEVIQCGSAGDLGFWTGLHHAQVSLEGRDRSVPMVLRTTEIFRRENGAWKLAHRHADLLKQSPPEARTQARAKITVHSSEANPYDQTATPHLLEIRLHETFSGAIDGESTVRALQVRCDDRSAHMVSMQRFHGRLAGRQGSFVLQGSAIVENGRIRATWFVVPQSGTGDLCGVRGEGGFQGEFGKESDGTLDYWFEP